MTATNWLRRVPGLLLPGRSFADSSPWLWECYGCRCSSKTSCTRCSGSGLNAPTYLQVDIAGVTPGPICAECVKYNGSHVLNATGTCRWYKELGVTCTSAPPYYLRTYGAIVVEMGTEPYYPTTLFVHFMMGPTFADATYTYDFGSAPNCLSWNAQTVNLTGGQQAACNNWPSTCAVTAL